MQDHCLQHPVTIVKIQYLYDQSKIWCEYWHIVSSLDVIGPPQALILVLHLINVTEIMQALGSPKLTKSAPPPASTGLPYTGAHSQDVAETFQALGSPEPITSDNKFRTRLLQIQSGLLILALHLQNVPKTLQTPGSPKPITNDDEFRMRLLLHIPETLQAPGSPRLIANDDEFRTCLLLLQSGLFILALHSQHVPKTLQAPGSPKPITNDDKFRMRLLQL